MNKYTNMQKSHYENTAELMKKTGNHRHHDANPDYHNILLSDIVNDKQKWYRKNALDFGCGQGRNVINLLKLAGFNLVDGCDISANNIKYATENTKAEFNSRFRYFVVNGTNLDCIEDNLYDFVMSTIVFQHICVYDIRVSIMRDIYRVMKDDGLFSFQMGFDKKPRGINEKGHGTVGYFDNHIDAVSTNGLVDVSVTDESQLVNDLTSIGFKNITCTLSQPFADGSHDNWIYVKAYK